jgi:hypothetical protein
MSQYNKFISEQREMLISEVQLNRFSKKNRLA